MHRFEILIPKTNGVPELCLQVNADDWLSALKAGLGKVGEDGAVTENILCDIKQDNSIHVTDTTTGRVFRMMQMDVEEDAYTTIPQMPGVEDTAVTIPEMPTEKLVDRSENTIPPKVRKQKSSDEQQSADVAPTTSSSGIGRAIDFTSDATADLLQEVFDLSQKVYDHSHPGKALEYVLDLAMKTIGTDSGSVFLADINTNELSFAATRGPKAHEVRKFSVKMGQGIAGFCAETAVGMAVSNANQDPRFYKHISDKIGYPTKSILCVPVHTQGQVFGAIELINKKAGSIFTERDLGVANFLGRQLAMYLERNDAK